jgi:WD40 repeat protein
VATVGGHILRLWDAVTGHALGELRGHPGVVSSLAFRPDGKAVALSQSDGDITVWAGR